MPKLVSIALVRCSVDEVSMNKFATDSNSGLHSIDETREQGALLMRLF